MKKLKYGIMTLALFCSCILATGCDLFAPRVERLQVVYTNNLQLLVGEDWHDDLIKGTATYTDNTKKDVTDEMTIDTSNYDKTKAGKYTINFEYEGVEVDYEVEVVEKLTDTTFINLRMQDVIENTFKESNNTLSFEANKEHTTDEGTFKEELI